MSTRRDGPRYNGLTSLLPVPTSVTGAGYLLRVHGVKVGSEPKDRGIYSRDSMVFLVYRSSRQPVMTCVRI